MPSHKGRLIAIVNAMDEKQGVADNWRKAVADGISAGAALAANLVYPPTCLGCGALTQRSGGFCPSCWRGLSLIEKPYCPVLGTPFSHDMGSGIVSAEAIADPPRFDRARAAVLYDGLARNLVHGLKYNDRTDLARTMAAWMFRASDGHVEACDLLLAVPLHRWRLLRRKFNQSAELARALAALSGRRFLPGGLIRTRATRQQVGLGAKQRQENVRGAFALTDAARAEIFGRRVVLVDDVYTTGATVNAASALLKRCGAADVTVLTFARVHGEHI